MSERGPGLPRLSKSEGNYSHVIFESNIFSQKRIVRIIMNGRLREQVTNSQKRKESK